MSHSVIYMLGNLLLIVKQFKADVSKMVDKMPKHDLDKRSRFLPKQKCRVLEHQIFKVFFFPTKHSSKD